MDATVAKPNYGFDVTTGDGYTQFHVVPPPFDSGAKFSIFYIKFGVMVTMMFVSLVVAFVGAGLFNSWFVFWLLLVGGTVLSWKMKGGDQTKVLVPVTIKVSAQGISVNQTVYAREHIREFWTQVGNTRAQAHQSEPNLMREVSASAAAGAHVAAAAANAINKRMYSVQMRYAADDVMLAQALPEGSANALLEKILGAYRAAA
nr:hypothetical protein [uncultured Albidiferax sp.]